MFPHPPCNPFIHNYQYLNPLYRLRRESHIKSLCRKAIQRLKKKRIERFPLPFRVSLMILNEFYILNSKKKYELSEFFGYFVKDPTRTIFQIFHFIDVQDDEQMDSLPTTIHGFDYWFVRNYLILSRSFLKPAKYLQRLVGYLILDEHTLAMLNKDTIHTLHFFCDFFNQNYLYHLNRMPRLRDLTLFPKEHSNLELVDHNDLCLPNLKKLRMSNIPNSISFQYVNQLRSLIIDDTYLDSTRLFTISTLPNLRKVAFVRCHLMPKYINLFSHRVLEHIQIYEGSMDTNLLRKVNIPSDITKLTTIMFRKVYGVPMEFFRKLFSIRKLKFLEVREANMNDDLLHMMLEKLEKIRWENIRLDIRIGNRIGKDYELVRKVEKTFEEIGKKVSIE